MIEKNWEIRSKEPFYMGDSIQQIPDVLDACLYSSRLHSMQSAMKHLKPSHIFTIGCGTSYNAAEAVIYFCRTMLNVPAELFSAYDFVIDTPPGVDSNALVIAFSHTGRTLPTCLAVEKANSLGAFTVGISSIEDSRLVKSANFGLVDGFGWEFRPRGKTRSFHTNCMLGMLTAMMITSPKRRKAFLHQAKDVSASIRQNLVGWEKSARYVASHWAGVTSRYIISGYGAQKSNADESGLKIIEVLGESATSYSLEEFTHGASASFRKDMGIILFQTDQRSLNRCLEIARGVVISKANLVIITNQPNAGWPKNSHVIYAPFDGEYQSLSLFPVAAAAQNLLYYLAIAKGVNPDLNCSDTHPELEDVRAIFFPPGTH